MIRASDALAESRRAVTLAGDAPVHPDWGLVAARIDKQATNHWNDESHVTRLEEAGVRIVRGDGRLDGPGRVVVGEDVYVAARGVVLNSGTAPARLPIDGLDDTPYWTNREIMKVTELPESLTVIGGGAGGVELALAFAFRAQSGLPLRVQLIAGRPGVMPSFAESVRARMRRLLQARGVRLISDDAVEVARHTVLLAEGGELTTQATIAAIGSAAAANACSASATSDWSTAEAGSST